MHIPKIIWVWLLPMLMALAACSGQAGSTSDAAPRHAAHLYVLDDVSGSSAVQGDDAFGNGIRKRAAGEVRKLALGDAVTVYQMGGGSAERFVAQPTITTGYKLRLDSAAKQVAVQMDDIARPYRANGGDGSTRISQMLNNLHPDCASGRSEIEIVSDGIEESDSYSVSSALNVGKPVELPPLSDGALRGCRVTMLGLGVSSNGAGGQVMPEAQLTALRAGWRKLLTDAGATDVTFTSLI